MANAHPITCNGPLARGPQSARAVTKTCRPAGTRQAASRGPFLAMRGRPLTGGAWCRPGVAAAPLSALLAPAADPLGGDPVAYAERVFVGEEVELTVDVPGHRRLQAGVRGRVVVTADDAPGNLVSVQAQGRLWLLPPKHLRRVAYAWRGRARA